MSTPSTASPATNLINLLIALLAPMFLWSSCGDIRLAQIAAAQTLNDYGVANRLSLWTVAKIIAFDIATLSSLSQSMYEDISISLALRLRGNATSLDRSGDRSRRALDAARRSAPAAAAEEPLEAQIARAEQMVRDAKTRVHAACSPEPETAADAAPPAAAPAPDAAAQIPMQPPRPAWPDAVTAVAEAFSAGVDGLPPEERWGEMARIMAMAAAAADLAAGAAPPPVPAMAAA
jgi:hypothetical protein